MPPPVGPDTGMPGTPATPMTGSPGDNSIGTGGSGSGAVGEEVPGDIPLASAGGSVSASGSVSAGGSVSAAGAAGAPASVDCSLVSDAPISVAWAAVNRQDLAWYATPEALTIAENVLYYRNANGGWPKNIDMTTRTTPLDAESTIDNRATTTQIEYLARVYSASSCARYGDPAVQGIEYLLEAQYDNGGWPQIYPNPDGYHAHITFNDDAMVHVLDLLRNVSAHAAPFAFVDTTVATNAAAAVQRGVDVILGTQIVIDGQKTGWCAQHDEVTLAPAQARTYELPSLSGSEGAGLFQFLMTIDQPSPPIIDAVVSAAAWFESVQLSGIRVQATVDATQETGEDRVVVEDPAAPPLWARFYELGTDRPIFSSRCEVPECETDPFFMRRYTLAEIGNERRVGYAWYGNWPARPLAAYADWRARWVP